MLAKVPRIITSWLPRRDAVGVEVLDLDPLLGQPAAGRAVAFDRPGGRDVVGGDRVAEQRRGRGRRRSARPRAPRPASARRSWAGGRRSSRARCSGRRRGPRPRSTSRRRRRPRRSCARTSPTATEAPTTCLISSALGPDVAQVDRLAVGALAERLVDEVDVHPAGERVGDDQRRAGQVVGLHVLVDPALEVAVAGEDGADRQVLLGDRRRDLRRQRPGVADAGGAAVADEVELERVEVLGQARPARGSR